ncbi:MAG: hypothetical protein QOI66_2681 [Myxococcales bacterium]|nr:hypothetical protein [Myxococcales bacterium]
MLTALVHVAEILGLTACWALAGYALLPRRLRSDETFLVVSTSFALGAGLTAVAVTLTAALGVMTRPVLWTVQGGVVLLAARGFLDLRRHGTHAFPLSLPSWPRRLAIAALLLMLSATLLATLAPPSSMDAMVYHLRAPHTFLQSGRWVPLPDIVQSFQPLYVEMLFGHGMALADDVLASLIHWALGVCAITTAGAWSRRLGGSALWGMLILGVSAIFAWESSSAFIDLGLACFAGLALLWATRPELGPPSWILAGIFSGLAAGSKLTGAFAAVLAAGTSLYLAAPAWRTGARRFLGIGALAVALALPWYVRNLMATGNPFYPIGNALLGLPMPTFSASLYGYGTSLSYLLRSPFDLVWRGGVFDKGWSLGPAYLSLVPLGLVLTARTKVGRVASASLVLWWLFWFVSSQQARLLLPMAPLAAGVAAVGARWALAAPSRLFRWAAVSALSVAATLGLAVALLTATVNARVATGMESASAFLRRNSWNYIAFEKANQLLPADARVAVVGIRANNLYYLDRPVMYFETAPSAPVLRDLRLSHVLDIGDCPHPASDGQLPSQTLWTGQYALVRSRLQGGVNAIVCARLSAVADSAPAFASAKPRL